MTKISINTSIWWHKHHFKIKMTLLKGAKIKQKEIREFILSTKVQIRHHCNFFTHQCCNRAVVWINSFRLLICYIDSKNIFKFRLDITTCLSNIINKATWLKFRFRAFHQSHQAPNSFVWDQAFLPLWSPSTQLHQSKL